MHSRISIKPSPESINEKKQNVFLIKKEVDVGGFESFLRRYQQASEEYDRFAWPFTCNFARAIRA